MGGFPQVLSSINDLTQDQILSLLISAKRLKMGVVPVGGHQFGEEGQPIASTLFLENSTRTKHSFAIAIQKIGGIHLDFDAQTSSLSKGESLEETFLTLKHQGVDLCIIRSSVSGQLEEFKNNPPIRLINGGDGINEHPTQALLDLMTFIQDGNRAEGKTMAIIGDVRHSRVSHSLEKLIPQFGGKIILCGPEECLPENSPGENITMTTDLEEAVKKSDYLYLLRIQKERHEGETGYYSTYPEKYGLSLDRLTGWNKQIQVYHPGPANIGVEISKDLIKSKLYRGYEQVTNSVFMRMAIIRAILHGP